MLSLIAAFFLVTGQRINSKPREWVRAWRQCQGLQCIWHLAMFSFSKAFGKAHQYLWKRRDESMRPEFAEESKCWKKDEGEVKVGKLYNWMNIRHHFHWHLAWCINWAQKWLQWGTITLEITVDTKILRVQKYWYSISLKKCPSKFSLFLCPCLSCFPCLQVFPLSCLSRLSWYLITNADWYLVKIVKSELQKRANRANQLVLFFLAGANFWEKHEIDRRKHAKTGKKQALFWC